MDEAKFNPIFGGVDEIVLTIREEGRPINADQNGKTIRFSNKAKFRKDISTIKRLLDDNGEELKAMVMNYL